MALANITHSDGVADDGGLTAETPVTVGTVTLPRNQAWNVWGLWYQAAEAGITTAEEMHIVGRVTASGGDVKPFNPSPFDFPVYSRSAIAGDGQPSFVTPWSMKKLNWNVAGGTTLTFATFPDVTVTTAPRVAMGIFYGVRPPAEDYCTFGPPAHFYDRVVGTSDGTTETSIGTMTLSETARVITGLCVTVDHATNTENEEIIGTFRITSDDIDLAPSIYPFSHVTDAVLDPAEAIIISQPYVPKFIPVRIPVPGGARIQFLTTLDVDVTAAAPTNCYVAYGP